MVIGVTGGLATGTSVVAKYIASNLRGYLIDADKLAHSTLRRDTPAHKAVVSSFGKGILGRDGSVDRSKLAERVFRNKRNLRRLCDTVHPLVISSIRTKIKDIYKKKSSAYIIVDGPVLIESGFYKECDTLVVVISSLGLQVERAQNFKGIKVKDAMARIKLQMPLHKKVRYADYIIDNNGDLKELRQACNKVVKSLKRGK